MMSQKPVRKLNKRLIYWCLLGLMALSIPAIVSLASSSKKEKTTDQKQREPHANSYAHDAIAIAGTEHFPETYGDVKEFEKELALKQQKEEPIAEALAGFGEVDQKVSLQHQASALSYRGHDDDPWREAMKREEKQRAFDYYDAKRSDIMFVDNRRNKARENAEPEDDVVLRTHDESDPHNMLLIKKSEARNNQREFMLSEGTLISAILLSEINTNLPGPILAKISHNIWDSRTGQTLLIPQNSKLIGEYNSSIGHGQNRAQIVWTRIIYPNQQSVDLARMVGVDKKGTSGSAGSVDNHYDKAVLGLLMTTALGAGVRMTQGKYDPNSASIGQDLGNSLAQETAQFGSRIADKMLSVKPTITISMGERLNVFVEQDLNLQPYRG